jgi:cytochrome b
VEAPLTNKAPGNGDNVIIKLGVVWDVLIRISGLCLLALLILAYVTGEEFQHTHAILGYAIAALLLISIYWELIRPHHARFPGSILSAQTIRAFLQSVRRNPAQATARISSAFAVTAIVVVLSVLAFSALLLMLLTHTLWRATSVDEMHEVVAYFALGLVVFHVAMVVIASGEHIERHVRKAIGSRKRHS